MFWVTFVDIQLCNVFSYEDFALDGIKTDSLGYFNGEIIQVELPYIHN